MIAVQGPNQSFPKFGASYRLADEQTLSLIIISDSYNAVLFQGEAPDVPERTLVNFWSGWQGDNIGGYLIGRNIFDEDYHRSWPRGLQRGQLGDT